MASFAVETRGGRRADRRQLERSRSAPNRRASSATPQPLRLDLTANLPVRLTRQRTSSLFQARTPAGPSLPERAWASVRRCNLASHAVEDAAGATASWMLHGLPRDSATSSPSRGSWMGGPAPVLTGSSSAGRRADRRQLERRAEAGQPSQPREPHPRGWTSATANLRDGQVDASVDTSRHHFRAASGDRAREATP